MNIRRVGATVMLSVGLVVGLSSSIEADAFRDPLETPAAQVRNIQSAHLSGIATAGDHLLAVGARGLIVRSEDAGQTWRQIVSPVSSDLLELFFINDQQGWIVGHDGVVLHSKDGGVTWTKQLDGHMAAELYEEHFQRLSKAGDETAESYLEVVRLNYMDGPEQALMDVWFANELEGFVVGTFGTILFTRDGGSTWESWMERVDNPEVLHFMSISGHGDEVFIASERGIVYRLDQQQQRFVAMNTGYSGSFFTLVATESSIFAGGLRGALYASDDHGQTWQRIPSGIQTAFTDTAVMNDGRIVMASIDGQLVFIGADEAQPSILSPTRAGLFSSVAVLQDEMVVTAGYAGIRPVTLH